MTKFDKHLNDILNYLSKNDSSFPDIQEICTVLNIPFDSKYKIQLEHDGYIENIAKNKDGDGFRITKSGKYFIEVENGYDRSKNEKNKSKVKSFFYNPYVRGILVVIIGGLLLAILLKYIPAQKQKITEDGHEILVIPNNYRIEMHNNEYPKLDTLTIEVVYRGINAVIKHDFKILEYKFDNNLYFHKDPDLFIEPEIEFLESFINNPLIDSTNRKQTIIIQIKRKMIFDGIREAYFEQKDKLQLGYLNLLFRYESNMTIKNDTLTFKMYLEK